nr:toll-like receptor 4 [Lytechinus pictus]
MIIPLFRQSTDIHATSCSQDFSLKIAFCSNKGFRHVPIDLLPDLRQLQLDNNLITTIENETFASWLKGTSVEILESRDTTCLDSKATLEPFRGKQLITFDPTGDCDANIVLYSSLTVVAMVLILTLGLIYYQRWWIRYRLFLLKLCFVGYEEIHDDANREEYQYDLAVMLHEADDEWVDQHLRPALVERLPDFNRIVCGDEELMLGMYYLDAVHYATEQSFKTIFVISRDALRDQWFLMKFRTVLDHVNDVGTEKMIIVFVEDIAEEELPFLIRLFLSDHRPYLIWPNDERGQYYFWEELVKDLTINLRCNHLVPPK